MGYTLCAFAIFRQIIHRLLCSPENSDKERNGGQGHLGHQKTKSEDGGSKVD
jgi:hypothetical protein